MYVTRRLSELLRSPEALTVPPEGPNSGYLVIQDEESETYSCFGLCKNRTIRDLPFPQNKELVVRYTTDPHNNQTSSHPVLLIPTLNHPLSSNRYYAIVPHGKHIGEAFTCSREDDKVAFCCCHRIKDVKSRPLDPINMYQQMKIVPDESLCASYGSFYADSVAYNDGFPPYFLRRKGWRIYTKTADNCKLDIAEGIINSRIRDRLPELNIPPSEESSIVGKWYCPFMFVKEGNLRDQVKKSMYYKITLEQRWEQIFGCARNSNHGNAVAIDALVETEEAFIDGIKAHQQSDTNEVVWFVTEMKRVGLRVEVVQRMKWEQQRFGYVSSEEQRVMVDRVEKYKGDGEWSKFGCYVLVERFNIRRMDGSLAMCYDFKHLEKMKIEWQ